MMAAHLHNRSPSRPLGGMTPFQARHGKKPNLSYLRVPSCRAYVHIPKDKRKGKLADHGMRGYLVGYSAAPSLYKIFDPATRRVITARDVVFDEGNNDCLAPIEVEDTFDSDEDIADAPPVRYSSKFREEPLFNPPKEVIET